MVAIEAWMETLTQKLKTVFQKRLLFVGLQGSYLRGEATEQSDIDVMVLLEELDLEDLSLYRSILSGMPHAELACGFICGRREFERWPKYELFQLSRGTSAYYGVLDDYLPEISDEEAKQSLQIGASALYHEICHRYLYGEQDLDSLQYAFKTVFYLLQLSYYLKSGKYISTKFQLCQELSGIEKELLEISCDWDAAITRLKEKPARAYELLLNWTGTVLRCNEE